MERAGVFLGILAFPLLFLSALFFGFLEPDYSHIHDSVSTLGALSAQHTLLMNVFGLFLPGIFVAVSFFIQARKFSKRKVDAIAMGCISLFGLMFAGLSLPMDLEPIPYVNFTAHYLLAYLSVIPFLVGSLLVSMFSINPILRGPGYRYFLAVLPFIFIGIHFSGLFGMNSGIVQRGLLVCIFVWIATVCHLRLIHANNTR